MIAPDEVTEPSTAESTSQPSEAEAPDTGVISTESGAQSAGLESKQVAEPSGAAPALLEEVRSELKSDTSLGAQNVQVSSEGGKIILKGTVSSDAEKEQIAEKVRETIIDNQIQVQSSQQGQPETQD